MNTNIQFTAECILRFNALNIKDARKRLKELNLELSKLNVNMSISEYDRQFDNGDLE